MTRTRRALEALGIAGVVGMVGLAWAFHIILQEPAPTQSWLNTSGEAVPESFRVLAFPRSSSVPVTDVDGRSVGVLDRAMLNSLVEMEQDKVALQMPSGPPASVRGSDLALDVDAVRREQFVDRWRKALAVTTPELRADRTWFRVHENPAGATQFDLQVDRGGDVLRFIYSMNGTKPVPLRIDFTFSKAVAIAAGARAMMAMVATFVFSVGGGAVWWIRRGRAARAMETGVAY